MQQVDPVRKIGVCGQRLLKLSLCKNDNLQQLKFIGFVVQQFPQDF